LLTTAARKWVGHTQARVTQVHSSYIRFVLGASIKYVTLFLANFDHHPLSHFVTQPGTPQKYVTHLGAPDFW